MYRENLLHNAMMNGIDVDEDDDDDGALAAFMQAQCIFCILLLPIYLYLV